MNILFIHSIDDIYTPEKPLRTPEQMLFGISYISALLKRHGHRTKLTVLSRILGKKNYKMIDDRLKEFCPKLICFAAVSTEYKFISGAAKYIKGRYPDIYLVIGGPHVSLNAEDILSDAFDALCIGEGEYPTLELASQLEEGMRPLGIPNLWIKNDLGVEKNAPRRVLQDLDSLPFPDREMWDEWIDEEEGSRYPVLLGRGCPFQCTYCCNHALRKIAGGPYVRFRSPENIVKEIEEFAARFPDKKAIYLEVETIGADRKWAERLCSKLEGLNAALDEPLNFGVNLRIAPNIDFDSLFAAFKKSNFKIINIGVESGSERVRKEILNRNYSNKDIINTVSLARKYGLKVHFYNLIGVPGETADDFKETLGINRVCAPDKSYTHIFYPYPGTELYSTCIKQGLLRDAPDTELERCKAVLDLPGFSKRQIQNGFIWFDYHIYRGRRPIYRILPKVFVSQCRSNSHVHSLYRRFTYSIFFKGMKRLLKRYV
ncbi:B12-binding domain-containing radical SAM protein [Candidatus Omnitrophota bacterium]